MSDERRSQDAAKPHGVMLAFDSSSVEGANRIREQIEGAMAKAGLAMFSWRIVEKDAPVEPRPLRTGRIIHGDADA